MWGKVRKMFKGRKTWAIITALVLLLGLAAPLGALAEVISGTLEVEANIYTNGRGDFSFSSFDLYELNSTWWDIADTPEDYQFQWSVCGGAKQSALYDWEDGSVWYSDTESSIRALVGKDVLRCNIFKSGRQVAALTIRLKACIYAPTVVGDYPNYEYIYFDAGKSLTIQLNTKLEIGGGETICYEYYKVRSNAGFEMLAAETTSTSVTFTPDANDHGATVSWAAATKGHDNWSGYAPDFILLDNAKKPIRMPSLAKNYEWIELKEGESTILTLPVAIAGDTAKELEYRWYTYDDSEPKLVQTSGYPSLTVTSKDVGTWRGYVCKVGYKGSAESTFLEYGQYFEVCVVDSEGNPVAPSTPTTPSNPSQSTKDVPKTGDSTPLTAMFILLGAALAGAAVLVGVRRRRSQS